MTTAHIAQNFRAIHFGGSWTGTNMQDILQGITWQQATTKVQNNNTIAVLVFHINYYVDAIIKVLAGEPLEAEDKYSFDCPPIDSEEAWQKLLEKTWADAKTFADLVERLPDSILFETFVHEKYGTYYRNLHGAIEHAHYHVGQIALLKKFVVA